MEDQAPSAGRGYLRLHDVAADRAGPVPSWWSAELAREAVPEPVRPLAERLAARLFADEEALAAGEAEAGPPEWLRPEEDDVPDGALAQLEAGWEAIEGLRSAILAAPARGAAPRAVRRLHRRLDGEARRLARDSFDRCLRESRILLRDVSHDLRSPLNSVLFLADTLMSEHSGALNEVQRRQVGVLYTAAVSLVGLVNDLIDASRIGEGREFTVARASLTMDAVLSDVKSLLGPLATHRGVRLRFQVETVGPRSGDRQLLSRLLINLVTNAIQASGEGGSVTIRVTGPREGWLRIEVRDDGEGGDEARLRRLVSEDVDPYRAGRSGGWTHGLGLSISSRLVRAAGGTITVESRAGVGTTFRVELPFPLVD